MKIFQMFVLILIMSLVACEKDAIIIHPGDDPNFTIVAHTNNDFKSFPKKVEVFGIPLYAVAGVEDTKLLHAANVMAQYLDNDEDGSIDNQLVVDKMIENKAFMVLWKKESDLNKVNGSDFGQDLGNDETIPSFVANGLTGSYDAALEEVLHIITHAGYAEVYPTIFGEQAGSKISDAMDIARGGQFTSIPSSYPDDAWYTYDDSTCEYDCMVTEYFYWSLTSILGAQANRLDDIQQEWQLNTKEKVETMDAAVYELLSDPQYKLPTVLPDGTYRR